MEKHWIKRGGDRLAVFVLGWAADRRVVEHIDPPGCDILYIYDYRGVEPVDAEEIAGYAARYLFAWSFGVWVAEQLFRGVAFDRAVALNGTPFPVHDAYGIQPRRLEVTIRGLAAGGMEPFDRRAYGNAYERLAPVLSPRTLAENIAELRSLRDLSVRPYSPAIQWNRAVVGSADVIFPPENMQNYWGSRAETLPLPHYPFGEAELILREIG